MIVVEIEDIIAGRYEHYVIRCRKAYTLTWILQYVNLFMVELGVESLPFPLLISQLWELGWEFQLSHRRVPSTVAIEEVMAAAAKGEAPPGLSLKGAGQDSSDAQPRANGITPKASDALSGELWEAKKERIQKASVYENFVIVKSGDDCRQEHLAVQLISHFYALIETISDTASLHAIKSRYPDISSLREFLNAKYEENSSSFKLAQKRAEQMLLLVVCFNISLSQEDFLASFVCVSDRN
ncbi:hypothetical protein RIF29_03716 [Crotalaria pallida]|uniref:Uncharacterized protein n=1 Tax=Crotalaria pallida TaxID=3830 RepID=A0AAN9J086_CROPI